MNKATGFESSIVSEWKSWDGEFIIQFNDARLAVAVGPYPAGQMVKCVTFDLEESEINIWEKDSSKPDPDWTGSWKVVIVS